MSDEATVAGQLIASAELARAAAQAGMHDTFVVYVPGDAPYVSRPHLHDQLEICTDGLGTFDVWQQHPQRMVKEGLSLAEAVAVLAAETQERH
jgi:hypothetical protein